MPALPALLLPRRAVWSLALASLLASPVLAASAAPGLPAQVTEQVSEQVAGQGAAVSLVAAGGDVLRAHWFPAAGNAQGTSPAIVALHGCGGLYTAQGKLSARYREVVARWNAAGYAVLLPDSLQSRGVRTACVSTPGQRRISPELRAGDAQAALDWLGQQPQVDARRLGLMGWSQGGSTSLQVLESAALQSRVPPLAGVAVYYPGCAGQLQRRASPGSVPLLMLLGEKDDWAPPQSCIAWGQQLQALPGVQAQVQVYPDSYHGFDSSGPVRVRNDILRGKPPQPVHQGGNPQARAASTAALDAFWQRVLAPAKEQP